MQGATDGEEFTIAPPSASYLAQVDRAPGGLRIGIMPQAWVGQRTCPPVVEGLAVTARLCASLDHEIEDANMPLGVSCDAFVHASSVLWAVNIAAWIKDMVLPQGERST